MKHPQKFFDCIKNLMKVGCVIIEIANVDFYKDTEDIRDILATLIYSITDLNDEGVPIITRGLKFSNCKIPKIDKSFFPFKDLVVESQFNEDERIMKELSLTSVLFDDCSFTSKGIFKLINCRRCGINYENLGYLLSKSHLVGVSKVKGKYSYQPHLGINDLQILEFIDCNLTEKDEQDIFNAMQAVTEVSFGENKEVY